MIKRFMKKCMVFLLLVAFIVGNINTVTMAKQLNGNSKSSLTQKRVYANITSAQVESVVLGEDMSSAITVNGDLYCWGRYPGIMPDTYENMSITPVKVLENVEKVVLGSGNRAAITTNGDLYCWGENYDYQVGNGSSETQYTPAKSFLSNVKDVVFGKGHTLALLENGDLYAWGTNRHGQLGNGTTTDSVIPTKIMTNISKISAASDESAAIDKEGNLYYWGGFEGYQGSNIRSMPIKVCKAVSECLLTEEKGNFFITSTKDLYSFSSYEPFSTEKILEDVIKFTSGKNHAAAITGNGDLYCWGQNYYGQVGNGVVTQSGTDIGDQYYPVKILENVTDVSLGRNHSAAVTVNGALMLWGNNWYGKIGNGQSSNADPETSPVKIMDNVKAVSLGVDHSAAVTTTGELYCWGDNSYGELGLGREKASADGNYKNIPAKIRLSENINTMPYGLIGMWESRLDTPFNVSIETSDNFYGWGGSPENKEAKIEIDVTGEYQLSAIAVQDMRDLRSEGSLYLHTNLSTLPKDFDIVAETITVGGKEYSFDQEWARLFDDDRDVIDGVNVGIVSDIENEHKWTNPFDDETVIPVQEGDIITIKFKVYLGTPANFSGNTESLITSTPTVIPTVAPTSTATPTATPTTTPTITPTPPVTPTPAPIATVTPTPTVIPTAAPVTMPSPTVVPTSQPASIMEMLSRVEKNDMTITARQTEATENSVTIQVDGALGAGFFLVASGATQVASSGTSTIKLENLEENTEYRFEVYAAWGNVEALLIDSYASTTITVKTKRHQETPEIYAENYIKKTYGTKKFSLDVASNSSGTLHYQSSNAKVARVSSTGQVTIYGYGEAKITVKVDETEFYTKGSKTINITIVPDKLKGFRVTSPKKGKILTRWKKDKTVKRCELFIADNKNFKNAYRYTMKVKKKKYQVGASRRKKYYVRMRSYIIVNGNTYYSAWTSTKRIKTK